VHGFEIIISSKTALFSDLNWRYQNQQSFRKINIPVKHTCHREHLFTVTWSQVPETSSPHLINLGLNILCY